MTNPAYTPFSGRLETNDVGWFMRNTTHVRFCSPGSTVVWSSKSSRDSLTISWDPESGNAHARSSEQSYTKASERGDHAFYVETARFAHQMLAQRAMLHPSRFGLTQKRVTNLQRSQPPSTLIKPGDQWSAAAAFLRNSGMIPEQEREWGVGWFTPDAHPDEFGTLFLYPTVAFASAGERIVWRLGVTGFSRVVVGEAEWNDEPQVRELCSAVRGYHSDYYVGQAVLQGTASGVRLARRRQEREHAATLAATAFSTDFHRLNVDGIRKTCLRVWKYVTAQETDSSREYVHDLYAIVTDGERIFFHLVPSTTPVAVKFTFWAAGESVRWDESRALWRPSNTNEIGSGTPNWTARYAAALAESVAEQRFGSTIMVKREGSRVDFFVTHEPNTILRYGPAFDIPANAETRVLSAPQAPNENLAVTGFHAPTDVH